MKYFVALISPTFERRCQSFGTAWEGGVRQFQLMEHGAFDLDVADVVMADFDGLCLHPFSFLVRNFIYDFSIALTQILRMMGKEYFSMLHFYRICYCFMTNFSGIFHMLLAFQILVWNSLLWILAFHIYHVILCGKVPLVIIPGVLRQYRLLLSR